MKRLRLVADFPDTLSRRGEEEVKQAVQDFREAVAHLGVVSRAELSAEVVAPLPTQEPT